MALPVPTASARVLLVAFLVPLLLAACTSAPPGAPGRAPGSEPAARGGPEAAEGRGMGPAAPRAPEQPTPGPAAQAAAPDAAIVRIGVVRTLTEAGMYIALERGYFTEQGIAIEFENFDTAARAVPALSTNQVDISSGVLSAGLFNAIERGVDVKITGPVSRQDADLSTNVILVRKDLFESGAIRDYADLRGRPFGAPSRGSTIEYSIDLAMRQVGLSADDLDWIELGFPEQIPAFANRAIDASFNTEPVATIAVNHGVAVKWRRVGDWAPGMQFTVIMYSPAFGTERNDVARRWMVAYLKGLRDYTDAVQKGINRRAMFEILARNTTLKDMDLYEQVAWANLDPNGRINLESIADQARWYVEKGLVRTLPDLGRIVDLQYVEYARAVLGEYR
jgi:NitT/TauT family transport system substrate-binding protein